MAKTLAEPSRFDGDRELTELLSKHVYWFLRSRLDTDSRPQTKMRAEEATSEGLKRWHARVRDEWGKLAERIFATLRFRKGDNFIDQFRSLFFESAQVDSRRVAEHLMKDTETVKTLTLALLAEQMFTERKESDGKAGKKKGDEQ